MNERSKVLPFSDTEAHACASCGSLEVRTSIEDQAFPYGVGDAAVLLHATVPVRTCVVCGFSYTDHEGEDARHEAVCRHLGVMMPTEVRNVREHHGLNRAEFAKVSGLVEASLARWESGSVVQNVANDSLLYLLISQSNVEALRVRNRGVPIPRGLGSREPAAWPLPARFRCIKESEELRRAARSFILRVVGDEADVRRDVLLVQGGAAEVSRL